MLLGEPWSRRCARTPTSLLLERSTQGQFRSRCSRLLLRGLATGPRVGLEFPHACGKGVRCLVKDAKQVVLATVMLLEVDGHDYGSEQRRANDTHAQLVRFCSSLAREQRRQCCNSGVLFLKETRPHLGNGHG